MINRLLDEPYFDERSIPEHFDLDRREYLSPFLINLILTGQHEGVLPTLETADGLVLKTKQELVDFFNETLLAIEDTTLDYCLRHNYVWTGKTFNDDVSKLSVHEKCKALEIDDYDRNITDLVVYCGLLAFIVDYDPILNKPNPVTPIYHSLKNLRVRK